VSGNQRHVEGDRQGAGRNAAGAVRDLVMNTTASLSVQGYPGDLGPPGTYTVYTVPSITATIAGRRCCPWR
jgi:hypothetical protein